MKKILLLLCLWSCITFQSRSQQQRPDAQVAQAAESFRQAMLQADQHALESLCAEKLSYGHSSGLVEDRSTCIASIVSGRSKFLTIDISGQTIDLAGETAIVRHTFQANTHDLGKEPGTVALKILQVWHKEAGKWKLLARQAVKLPTP
jgi:ketosteroid isomerase-like protein